MPSNILNVMQVQIAIPNVPCTEEIALEVVFVVETLVVSTIVACEVGIVSSSKVVSNMCMVAEFCVVFRVILSVVVSSIDVELSGTVFVIFIFCVVSVVSTVASVIFVIFPTMLVIPVAGVELCATFTVIFSVPPGKLIDSTVRKLLGVVVPAFTSVVEDMLSVITVTAEAVEL